MNCKPLFEIIGAGGKIPAKATAGSAGEDLFASEPAKVSYGAISLIHTGIRANIPRGYYGRIAPRSGLAFKHGMGIGGGVIDSDYEGEICVIAYLVIPGEISFAPGDRVAQIIIEKIYEDPAESAFSCKRLAGGFGSTGL